MRRLFRQAGIKTLEGRVPRTHDLRFTFTNHALLRWYRDGVDAQAHLPALSAYLGHVSIASTEYYLSFISDIGQMASDRFESHCSEFLKVGGMQ